MVNFRSIFYIFLSFNAQLTDLNASNLLNFDSLNHFSPIASQSWCSGVSKMATYIYIYIYISCRFISSKILHHRCEISRFLTFQFRSRDVWFP